MTPPATIECEHSCGFDDLFARQIEALAEPDDVGIGIIEAAASAAVEVR